MTGNEARDEDMFPITTPNGIKVKDKVRLLSGTIVMVVGQLSKTAHGFMVTCHWEEKGKIKTGNFSADVLEKV